MHLYSSKSGALLKSLYQKKFDNWCPQWSADEFLCARLVSNEVQFYAKNDFSALHKKLCLTGVTQFALAQQRLGGADQPTVYNVGVFVPGSKGSPCSVRVFRFPEFDNQAVLSNKSFYRADTVSLSWSPRGTDLLVQTATEMSADSYYGEQGLFFLSTRRGGESALVPLQKKGPVYHTTWTADGTEFLVTHGFMPAKVTVYNLRCEPVFDFGTGPRNAAHFNPQGNLLALCGFGNLRGDCELWDYARKTLLSRLRLPDCTQFSWCPDGEHLLSATTAPRLRVHNGLRVVHYSGQREPLALAAEGELWEAIWQGAPAGRFPTPTARAGRLEVVEMSKLEVAVAKVATDTEAARVRSGRGPAVATGGYVPPHLRGRPGAGPSKLLDKEAYEAASNQRGAAHGEGVSKAAAKNRRRKEAREAAGGRADAAAPPAPQPWMDSFEGCGDLERDKRLKNVLKKLDQIEKLKLQQEEGRQLELNQLDKLAGEALLLDELKALRL